MFVHCLWIPAQSLASPHTSVFHRLVHLFSWEPGGPVTVSVHRDAPYAFLPSWYVETMTQDLPPLSKTPSPKD